MRLSASVLAAGLTATTLLALPRAQAAGDPAISAITFDRKVIRAAEDLPANMGGTFVVTLPEDAAQIGEVGFGLERVEDGFTFLKVTQGCEYAFTCERAGNTVTVTYNRPFATIQEAAWAVDKPGAYRPYATVQLAGAANTVRAVSSMKVLVLRDTEADLDVDPGRAAAGQRLTMTVGLQRTTGCPGRCDFRGSQYKDQKLTLWFDPAGKKKAFKIAKLRTPKNGQSFVVFHKHRGTGAWYTTFKGDGEHMPATSKPQKVRTR